MQHKQNSKTIYHPYRVPKLAQKVWLILPLLWHTTKLCCFNDVLHLTIYVTYPDTIHRRVKKSAGYAIAKSDPQNHFLRCALLYMCAAITIRHFSKSADLDCRVIILWGSLSSAYISMKNNKKNENTGTFPSGALSCNISMKVNI